MKNSSLIKSTTLVLLALSAHAETFPGCAHQVSGICYECYHRRPLPNGRGCGPTLPTDDTCTLYQVVGIKNNKVTSECSVCKPGYALQGQPISNGTFQYTCIPGTIQNCVFETVHYSHHVCLACKNGTYSVKNPNGSSSCQKVNNTVSHCQWGSVQDGTGFDCFRCKSGFAVDVDTKKCQPVSQPGCWVNESPKRCLACNPFLGYSVTTENNCVKHASSEFDIKEEEVSGVFGIGGF